MDLSQRTKRIVIPKRRLYEETESEDDDKRGEESESEREDESSQDEVG